MTCILEMIRIIKDVDPIFEVENYDVFLLGTTIYCDLIDGLQSKMRYKFPILQEEDDKTPYADSRKLGTRLTINDINGEGLTVSLLYMCRHYRSKNYIDYDAIEKCFRSANGEFKGLKVATTIVGSSPFDGNGDKEKCLEIIKNSVPDLDLTIYDYEQKKRKDEINEFYHRIYLLEKTDKKEFEKQWNDRFRELNRRYLLAGRKWVDEYIKKLKELGLYDENYVKIKKDNGEKSKRTKKRRFRRTKNK